MLDAWEKLSCLSHGSQSQELSTHLVIFYDGTVDISQEMVDEPEEAKCHGVS